MTGPYVVLPHEAHDADFTHCESAAAQFSRHAWTTIGTLDLGVNGTNQRQQLRIGQPLAIRLATAFPGSVAGHAHLRYLAQLSTNCWKTKFRGKLTGLSHQNLLTFNDLQCGL